MRIRVSAKELARMELALGDFANESHHLAGLALYEGAGYLADKMNEASQQIQTEPFRYASSDDKRYPSPQEAAAVKKVKAGIAKFKGNPSSVTTSVGYHASGYVTIAGQEKPVGLIANAIESGTSFMVKQPFMRAAAIQHMPQAEAIVKKALKRIVGDYIKKNDL